MLRRFCKIVLALLLLMAIFTPVMQLDSWDSFPVSSDDIEAQATYCLCFLGMVVVVTGILKLFPVLLRSVNPLVTSSSGDTTTKTEFAYPLCSLARQSAPLRI